MVLKKKEYCLKLSNMMFVQIFQRTLPALARVRQTRIPNAYDRTALNLEEGDIIKVKLRPEAIREKVFKSLLRIIPVCF